MVSCIRPQGLEITSARKTSECLPSSFVRPQITACPIEDPGPVFYAITPLILLRSFHKFSIATMLLSRYVHSQKWLEGRTTMLSIKYIGSRLKEYSELPDMFEKFSAWKLNHFENPLCPLRTAKRFAQRCETVPALTSTAACTT
jgi:hypothetical protein